MTKNFDAIKRASVWAGLAVLVIASFAPEVAMAGTGDELQEAEDMISGLINGSGGRLAALLALGMAVAGSVLKFNLPQMVGAVGVGIAAGVGAGFVTTGVTAII